MEDALIQPYSGHESREISGNLFKIIDWRCAVRGSRFKAKKILRGPKRHVPSHSASSGAKGTGSTKQVLHLFTSLHGHKICLMMNYIAMQHAPSRATATPLKKLIFVPNIIIPLKAVGLLPPTPKNSRATLIITS